MSQPQTQRRNAGQKIEGEGSRSADRNYREKTTAFARSGKAEEKAKEAAEALDGPQGDELRRAEERGRRAQTGQGDSDKS